MSSYTRRLPLKAIRIVMVIVAMVICLTIDVAPVFADDAPPLPPTTEETPVVPSSTDEINTPDAGTPVEESTVPSVSELTQPTEYPSTDQIPQDQILDMTVDNLEDSPSVAQQDTANTLLVGDPVWCPAGKVPGETGCTTNFPSVTNLILGLGTKSGDGTIYFTSTYNDADVSFNCASPVCADVELKDLGTLTLQGGWNGSNYGAGYLLSGVTTFIAPITIVWSHSVFIKDISATGLDISTSNTTVTDITLSNVSISNSTGAGATLNNGSAGATGNVYLTGTNSFNDNTGDGLAITTNGNVSVTGSVTANSNGGDGLHITSNGTVTMENITAGRDTSTGNGGDGADIRTTGIQVEINGSNIFNNNNNNGLKIESSGAINLLNITANNNAMENGALLTAVSDISVQGANRFIGNAMAGIAINTLGDVTIYGSILSKANGTDGFYVQAANALIDCGRAVSNTGYELNDRVTGNLIWHGNALAETDILTDGSGTVELADCEFPGFIVSDGDISTGLSLSVIRVFSGVPVTLDCESYYGILLVLPNGDSAYIACPVYGEASLTSIAQMQDEPSGTTFASGFILDFINVDIPVTGKIVPIASKNNTRISFVIPEGKSGADYDILYWDNGKWTPVSNPVFEDGKLTAQVDFMGTFILVDK